MHRVFNFSAGPAALPTEVLQQAQAEMLDWHGTGMSLMEMSHRGEAFTQVAEQAEADLRELLAIPAHYRVLFLAGGATTQFSMVPMNLLTANKAADYIETGQWSQKAIVEAECYGTINIAARVEKTPHVHIPPQEHWLLDPKAAYVHYTPNETIDGIEFHWVPKTGAVPLVADMSSTLLSRPINVGDYGIIYAGAQKNIGPAGLTIVIIREDLLREPIATTPVLYNYRVQAENKSCYNTPPTYSWYLAGLVFAWLKRQGGLTVMAERNQRKANKLYNFIDAHPFYSNNVDPQCRSWMNVPFSLRNDQLDKTFLAEAEKAGLTNLKGHRLVGGMRASIYNAMPEEGVDALIEFMQHFAQRNSHV
jgi:phosphoserine aminotransferase